MWEVEACICALYIYKDIEKSSIYSFRLLICHVCANN